MSFGERGVGVVLDGVRARTEGLPREHVGEIQRRRVLTAMAQAASERGAGALTIAHVVARAGVSRRTFYDLFADREECFLAALEDAIGRLSGPVVEAYGAAGAWRERVRAGLWALLGALRGSQTRGRSPSSSRAWSTSARRQPRHRARQRGTQRLAAHTTRTAG